MKPRILLARLLNRAGRFLQSLDIMVMKPDDLVEYTRSLYSRSDELEAWTGNRILGTGLYPREKNYLKSLPLKRGRLLILGLGGGREAIPLAKKGFKVTGIDFVPEMVQRARANAFEQGVEIETFVQNITEINLPASSFDLVWISYNMYSGIPTRKRRLRMLEKVHHVLKPKGYFLCQFFWYTRPGFSKTAEIFRKIFAFLTMGNFSYEKGDLLWLHREFIHAFSSEELLKSEFSDGGFKVVEMFIPEKEAEGAAILRKKSNGI